jgi:hypothetical protein
MGTSPKLSKKTHINNLLSVPGTHFIGAISLLRLPQGSLAMRKLEWLADFAHILLDLF